MDDEKIIGLLFKRDENAIKAVQEKYGAYCKSIAYNILHNDSDAEECVNEALFNVWQSVPPNHPQSLCGYTGKCVRYASLKRLRESNAIKRGGGEVQLAYSEISEFITAKDTTHTAIEAEETGRIINEFLSTLSKKDRQIFVCRYWYFDSVSQIAEQFGFSESKIKSILFRTRKKLKIKLEKEGAFYE